MIRKSIQTILAVTFLLGSCSIASADIWGHVDRQANDIERAAKLLRTEVDHYRHTRYYGQLIGATARLKGQAIHAHNIADHSQSVAALKIAVSELGRAFVDAEYLFDQAEQDAAYGSGRIRGNTAHVKQQLNRIGACIGNLKSDLVQLNRVVVKPTKVYRAPVVQQQRAYRGYDDYRGSGKYGKQKRVSQPVYRSSRSGYRGGGGVSFSIGGGSSRLVINF